MYPWTQMSNGTPKPALCKQHVNSPCNELTFILFFERAAWEKMRQCIGGELSDSRYLRPYPKVKGVMTSLVCRFWSLPWTNGPNTQFKWKLRYSPIQCAYLEPLVMHFSDRQCNRIGLKIFKKLTQSYWCLHWFLGLCADVWEILLQVYNRPVVTQVYIEKTLNKNIEIGFQSAIFLLCQGVLVPLSWDDRGPNATASI